MGPLYVLPWFGVGPGYAGLVALTIAVLFGVWSGDSGLANYRSPGKCLVRIQAVRPVRAAGNGGDRELNVAAGNGGDRELNVAPGRRRGAKRMLWHVADVTFGLGLVSVLVSRYNRTIADAMTGTIHIRLDGWEAKALLAAAPRGAVDAT